MEESTQNQRLLSVDSTARRQAGGFGACSAPPATAPAAWTVKEDKFYKLFALKTFPLLCLAALVVALIGLLEYGLQVLPRESFSPPPAVTNLSLVRRDSFLLLNSSSPSRRPASISSATLYLNGASSIDSRAVNPLGVVSTGTTIQGAYASGDGSTTILASVSSSSHATTSQAVVITLETTSHNAYASGDGSTIILSNSPPKRSTSSAAAVVVTLETTSHNAYASGDGGIITFPKSPSASPTSSAPPVVFTTATTIPGAYAPGDGATIVLSPSPSKSPVSSPPIVISTATTIPGAYAPGDGATVILSGSPSKSPVSSPPVVINTGTTIPGAYAPGDGSVTVFSAGPPKSPTSSAPPVVITLETTSHGAYAPGDGGNTIVNGIVSTEPPAISPVHSTAILGETSYAPPDGATTTISAPMSTAQGGPPPLQATHSKPPQDGAFTSAVPVTYVGAGGETYIGIATEYVGPGGKIYVANPTKYVGVDGNTYYAAPTQQIGADGKIVGTNGFTYIAPPSLYIGANGKTSTLNPTQFVASVKPTPTFDHNYLIIGPSAYATIDGTTFVDGPTPYAIVGGSTFLTGPSPYAVLNGVTIPVQMPAVVTGTESNLQGSIASIEVVTAHVGLGGTALTTFTLTYSEENTSIRSSGTQNSITITHAPTTLQALPTSQPSLPMKRPGEEVVESEIPLTLIKYAGNYFLGLYFPILAAVLLRLCLSYVYRAAKLVDPFAMLTAAEGVPLSRFFWVDYLATESIQAPYTAFRSGRWLTLWTAMLYASSQLLAPFASEIIHDHETIYKSAVPNNPDEISLSYGHSLWINVVVVRILQGLLGLIAVLLLYVCYLSRNHKSGIYSDPSSIATVASLINHPAFVRELVDIDQYAEKSTIPGELAGKRYRLDWYISHDGAEKYGIVPIYDSIEYSSGGFLNRQSLPLEPAPSFSSQPWSMTELPPPISRRSWTRLVKDSAMTASLIGLLVLVVVYYINSSNTAYERFMDSQGFGPRFLLTCLAIIIKMQWTHIERVAVAHEPYRRLYRRPHRARSSILVEHPLLPVTSFVQSLANGSFYVATVAAVAVLAEVLIILLPGVPFSSFEMFISAQISWFGCMGILGAMLLAAIAVWLHPGHLWPKKPNSLGAVALYVAGSRLADDLGDLASLGRAERNRKVESWGATYSFFFARGKWLVDYSEPERGGESGGGGRGGSEMVAAARGSSWGGVGVGADGPFIGRRADVEQEIEEEDGNLRNDARDSIGLAVSDNASEVVDYYYEHSAAAADKVPGRRDESGGYMYEYEHQSPRYPSNNNHNNVGRGDECDGLIDRGGYF